MPTASSNWTVAKIVLMSTLWCAIRRASQLIGLAMVEGLPDAVPASIWLNPLLYMNDWYCSTASSSQMAARYCSSRRASGGRQVLVASVASRHEA